MDARAVALLACPVCAQHLELSPGVLRCPAGHSYDLARQGHVNLLGGAEPANADTPAMLQARGRVHASGLFDEVAEAVAAQVRGSRLLEAGAGNGFYLARALERRPEAVGIALDVSKAAARAAVRAHPRIGAVVADVWRNLPIRDRCLDTVLCVFAPRNLPEFRRVLEADGRLVVVLPNAGHLDGLRDRYGLLKVDADKAEQLTEAAAGLFEPVESVRISAASQVDAERALDLIAMGPNAFHRLPEVASEGEITVDVTLLSFRPLPT
ncbi:MAG TPA: methyltransferase domain-containing protein [Propionicimonas sp.]|nr:methyltransferase domain-containing protein [Propionicimonas sp.]